MKYGKDKQININMGRFLNKFKGFIFFVLLFLSSFFGTLVFGGFLLPVFFLHPAVYRHFYDCMIGLWLWFAAVRILPSDSSSDRSATLLLAGHT